VHQLLAVGGISWQDRASGELAFDVQWLARGHGRIAVTVRQRGNRQWNGCSLCL